jgi:hypothetical protein
MPDVGEARNGSLVLDRREVSVLDSTDVRMLLTWHLTDGTVFGVIAGPPAVQHVLEVAGVAECLTYVLVARRLETAVVATR